VRSALWIQSVHCVILCKDWQAKPADSPCASIPAAQRFKPIGRVAQLAEHSALNRQVVGSIPTASTIPRAQMSRPETAQLSLLVRWAADALEGERHACSDAALILRKHHRAGVRDVRSITFRKQIAYVQ
jgi:hypothetical protein